MRVLLAGALMAVGLAAAAAPAGAVPGRADAALAAGANPACPYPVDVARQAAARFSDIEADHAHAANIGCLVFYGITAGAGDGSQYDPSGAVKRWQMALFMTRAVEQAGGRLPAADQGFADLDDVNSVVAAGINAAAALGIMPGTSDSEFSPDEPVLRADMALHLVRMLELLTDAGSPINVKVDDASGAVTMTERDGGTIVVDDSFGDMDGVVSEAAQHAIGAIYELGVTSGKAPGVYDPFGGVTRAQMATFIIRMLGHSSLRPGGSVVLEPWAPPAKEPLPADPGGVYAGDPLHLIAYASFDRAYSLPDDGEDRLEVWLCNTPQSGGRYSTHKDNRHNPDNYADKFASQVTLWFEWLSNGLYRPVFAPGGVVEVGRSDDYYQACDEAVAAQDFSGRTDIDGAVIVVGTAAVDHGPVGMASCGFFSQRGFPANGRSVLVNGDAFTDAALLAHELGHALCWPHSYSGETLDDFGEISEYDNPMDIMGSALLGVSNPVPMVGTHAVNRYAAGWIPTQQVRVHELGTTAQYDVVPAGHDGVQLVIVPVEEGDTVQYYALGVRLAETEGLWWADAGLPAEGVEIYWIDQSAYGCDLPDRGYCYGLYRQTVPVFDGLCGYDPWATAHVMGVGDGWSWTTGLGVDVTGQEADTFNVLIHSEDAADGEPPPTGEWSREEFRAASGERVTYYYLDSRYCSDSDPFAQFAVGCLGGAFFASVGVDGYVASNAYGDTWAGYSADGVAYDMDWWTVDRSEDVTWMWAPEGRQRQLARHLANNPGVLEFVWQHPFTEEVTSVIFADTTGLRQALDNLTCY